MPHRTLAFQVGKNLILIGVVAGVYFLFGLVGLWFRLPADPVGIIYPATGFALAATLLLGVQALPAVIIGSMCVNAWYFNFNLAYSNFYAASAFGAALSAWVSCVLVRRLVGFPDPLIDAKKIALFLFVAAPLGCLFLVVINIAASHASGIIALDDVLISGVKCWLAEILGVLIFTPLILILFAEPHHVRIRRRKSGRFSGFTDFCLSDIVVFLSGST